MQYIFLHDAASPPSALYGTQIYPILFGNTLRNRRDKNRFSCPGFLVCMPEHISLNDPPARP